LAGDDPTLDTAETENHLELKIVAQERQFHSMGEVHHFLEMGQVSQNLHTTQPESHTQIKQMTEAGYIADTDKIFQASWLNFQHDAAAAFILLERSPMPPALPAKHHAGGRKQILHARRLKRIDLHSAKSDDNIARECKSGTRPRPV
jgi:hypothetical protein